MTSKVGKTTRRTGTILDHKIPKSINDTSISELRSFSPGSTVCMCAPCTPTSFECVPACRCSPAVCMQSIATLARATSDRAPNFIATLYRTGVKMPSYDWFLNTPVEVRVGGLLNRSIFVEETRRFSPTGRVAFSFITLYITTGGNHRAVASVITNVLLRP